jgi:hypothetical protein
MTVRRLVGNPSLADAYKERCGAELHLATRQDLA